MRLGFTGSARPLTWATVRMARRAGLPITIVWPSGRIEFPPTQGEQ